MKPSIGRIVHYNSRQGPAAAIVINVHKDETTVDLQVFDRDGGSRVVHVVEMNEDQDALGTWQWPPRV